MAGVITSSRGFGGMPRASVGWLTQFRATESSLGRWLREIEAKYGARGGRVQFVGSGLGADRTVVSLEWDGQSVTKVEWEGEVPLAR